MSQMISTALLVIDMQQTLVKGAFDEADVLARQSSLIAQARREDITIVFIQHNHASFEAMRRGTPGWQIHSQLDVRDTDLRIEKTASDAFYQTQLHAELQAISINHLVVTGMMTEYCVDTSCRAALSLGYSVTLVADAHTTGPGIIDAATTIAHHNAILANIAHPQGPVTVLPAQKIEFDNAKHARS
jgi:nicotinamidase-related amidase